MSETTMQIIPMLSYEDGIAAMDWLCRVFGFSEKTRMVDENGRLAHGEIVLGTGMIMLASPSPAYQSPKHHRQVCEQAARWYEVPYIINGVLVYVEDVENHFQKAKALGAVILSGLEAGGPGLRYRVEDFEGQRWMFMQKA
jgi:PhnB protein